MTRSSSTSISIRKDSRPSRERRGGADTTATPPSMPRQCVPSDFGRSPMTSDEPPRSSLVLYQTEDGRTRIQCRFDGDSIWLTQVQLAELFQTSVPNVNLHLKAIFSERELLPEATIKSSLMVRRAGCRARATDRTAEGEAPGRHLLRRHQGSEPRRPDETLRHRVARGRACASPRISARGTLRSEAWLSV